MPVAELDPRSVEEMKVAGGIGQLQFGLIKLAVEREGKNQSSRAKKLAFLTAHLVASGAMQPKQLAMKVNDQCRVNCSPTYIGYLITTRASLCLIHMRQQYTVLLPWNWIADRAAERDCTVFVLPTAQSEVHRRQGS